MESSQDIELINQAIQKLIQEKRIKDTSVDKLSEDDDEQLLSRLLSQLESLKGGEEEVTSPRADKADAKSENGSRVGSGCGETDMEEILKELKAVKRQNTITHCLLSVLIVVTMVWQFSEVSIFLKVKDGFSHPFRSFGSMLVGMLPSPRAGINDVHDADKDSTPQNHNHNPLVPELPHLDFPNLGSYNGGGL